MGRKPLITNLCDCKDDNKKIIKCELSLYMSNLKDPHGNKIIITNEVAGTDGKKKYEDHFHIEGCYGNSKIEQIYLYGDTLVTRKKMYRAYFHKGKQKVQNNNDIYSFFLVPFIKGQRNGKKGIVQNEFSINTSRASWLYDNPFAFFAILKELYKDGAFDDNSSLNSKEYDTFQCLVIRYKAFWSLFGKGIGGYQNYLSAFCLECVNDLEEYYPQYFCKELSNKDDEYLGYSNYELLLNEFVMRRHKEIMIRNAKTHTLDEYNHA